MPIPRTAFLLGVCSELCRCFCSHSSPRCAPGTAGSFKTLMNSFHTGGRSSRESYLDQTRWLLPFSTSPAK